MTSRAFLGLMVLGFFVATRLALAQEAPKSPVQAATEKAEALGKSPKVARLMRPDVAVGSALEDAKALAATDPRLALACRYVMVNEPLLIDSTLPNGEATKIDATKGALSLAANTAFLVGSEPYRLIPIPTLAGESCLYRVDLAAFYDYDEKRLRLALDTWDRMQDSQFYIRTDQLKLVSCPRTPWTDPKTGKAGVYTGWNINVLIPAAHANVNGALTELCKLTGCMVPIISSGQFLRYTLNSDFGGLYPEFQQLDLSPVKGSAEDAFLALSGIVLDELDKRRSNRRVILTRKPTSSPGSVEYFWTEATGADKGPGLGSITRDYFTGVEIDPNKHPFENLLDRKHDGSEIFAPTPAGGFRFGLFDGKGGFVRSAPLNPPKSLAADRTIPAPFLPILQGPSGCIRCHIYENPETKRFGLFQPAPNYLKWMLDVEVNGQRFDIFAELTKGKTTKDALKNVPKHVLFAKDEALSELVSTYNGETDNAFSFGGQTYAAYVFDASGLTMETAITAMMTLHDNWLYAYVSPRKALLTLGYKTESEEEASVLFDQLIPPAPEPLRITQLRAWKKGRRLPLTIDDWLAVYPEAAARVYATEQAQLGVVTSKPVGEPSP